MKKLSRNARTGIAIVLFILIAPLAVWYVVEAAGRGSYALIAVYKANELIGVSVSAQIKETYMFLNIPDDQEAELAKYTDWENYFRLMRPVDVMAD